MIFIYMQLWCVCVLCAPAGRREGTGFPRAMPAGAPGLNKVNWLIGPQQVKAQLVMITLCRGLFFALWFYELCVYIVGKP